MLNSMNNWLVINTSEESPWTSNSRKTVETGMTWKWDSKHVRNVASSGSPTIRILELTLNTHLRTAGEKACGLTLAFQYFQYSQGFWMMEGREYQKQQNPRKGITREDL